MCYVHIALLKGNVDTQEIRGMKVNRMQTEYMCVDDLHANGTVSM